MKLCKNPNHKVHIANFIKKYPTAKGRVPQTIILVDPKDWSFDLEHPEKNITECCQVCSIAEDIALAKRGALRDFWVQDIWHRKSSRRQEV